jgi:hypothetical protein
MSREALAQVVERASTDAAFRAQLQSNPESAVTGYDLTPEERAALRSRDTEALRTLGVDARISKVDNPAEPGDAFPTGPFSGGTG